MGELDYIAHREAVRQLSQDASEHYIRGLISEAKSLPAFEAIDLLSRLAEKLLEQRNDRHPY